MQAASLLSYRHRGGEKAISRRSDMPKRKSTRRHSLQKSLPSATSDSVHIPYCRGRSPLPALHVTDQKMRLKSSTTECAGSRNLTGSTVFNLAISSISGATYKRSTSSISAEVVQLKSKFPNSSSSSKQSSVQLEN